VLQAFVNGEPAERLRIAAELRDTLPYVAYLGAWTVGLFGRDLEGAARLARVWAGNSGDFGPVYRMILADLALARGRREAAQAELRQAAGVRPGWALEHRGLLAISPAAELPAAELTALRDELLAWDPGTERPSVYPHQSIQVPQRIRPLTRLMLLGVLSAMLGDGAAAERYAAEVEQVGQGEHGKLAQSIAREIRARLALRRGDARVALAILEADSLAFRDDQLRFSPVYARISERFSRAEALRLAGRREEALGWYASIVSQNLHELVYLAPAEWRRAEMYESLGMLPEAERSRRAARALWRDADPGLLPAGGAAVAPGGEIGRR
jgi:tetratricopeptide (TPR) repeat protein